MMGITAVTRPNERVKQWADLGKVPQSKESDGEEPYYILTESDKVVYEGSRQGVAKKYNMSQKKVTDIIRNLGLFPGKVKWVEAYESERPMILLLDEDPGRTDDEN